MTELVHVISGFKIWNSGLGRLSSYVLFPLCLSLGSLNNYGFLIRKKKMVFKTQIRNVVSLFAIKFINI